MEWKYYDEALNVIRDYNLEKNVLIQVDKILKKLFNLCIKLFNLYKNNNK